MRKVGEYVGTIAIGAAWGIFWAFAALGINPLHVLKAAL